MYLRYISSDVYRFWKNALKKKKKKEKKRGAQWWQSAIVHV